MLHIFSEIFVTERNEFRTLGVMKWSGWEIPENICNMKGTNVNNNILPSKQLRGKIHAERKEFGTMGVMKWSGWEIL
jgi:hypothetical protein